MLAMVICGQNRGFSLLTKFYCPPIIGTRETGNLCYSYTQPPCCFWKLYIGIELIDEVLTRDSCQP